MKSLGEIYNERFREFQEINPWNSPKGILQDFEGEVSEIYPCGHVSALVHFVDGSGALVRNFRGDSVIAETPKIVPLSGEEYWKLRLQYLSPEFLRALRRRVEDRLRKSQDELIRAAASLINRGQVKVSDLI